MNTDAGRPPPRWLLPAFVALAVLPFHPLWVDFEQVRRGLLLLAVGLALLVAPGLPRVRGGAAWFTLLGFLGVASLISWPSLQGYEALYRVAHFAALVVVLRLGAAARGQLAIPFAIALLLTSAFGLCQRLGFAAIGSYGLATEPVSVFGNLNVAAEWTAVAAMAVLVLPTARRGLAFAAVGVAAAYLAVNGSRGGLIAFGIGLVVLALVRRRVSALAGPAVALLGAACGLLVALAPLPAAAPPPDASASTRGADTLEVRLEIMKSSTQLFAERPLFGFGPGQFQVQYPRVRSQREIELSSHGRKFASEVRTAHDDWIELLVEGGVPLVLAFAAALFALQRQNRDKVALLPLFVLLLLMLARAPLANAPAVLAALLPVGSALPPAPPSPWRTALRVLLGLGAAGLGFLPIAANCAFTPYVAAIAEGRHADITAAMRAYRWMWWEPRWLQVLSQEQLAYGNLPEARKAAAMAVELRPHDPRLLQDLAAALSRSGSYAEAVTLADAGLQSDPQDPELRVLRSTALMLQKRYDEAVTAVTVDPHERLRDRLPLHFLSLERVAEQRGDAIGAARCRMEQAFLSALDAIGTDDEKAQQLVKQFLTDAVAAGQKGDPRVFVLGALQALAVGDGRQADDYAVQARKRGDVLQPWQVALFGDKLEPLRARASWAAVLRTR
ncbi:MAG: O-antigen ligase family protein [Planctomycetota bacterium]